jgi:predicted alpha/beta-hydrolase family hydrolase
MAWTAMAGKHTFVVPDEHRARALADAFVAFGYPLVMAGPHDMSRFVPEWDRDRAVTDWTVTVVDEGPYATDAQGSREWEAGRWKSGMR